MPDTLDAMVTEMRDAAYRVLSTLDAEDPDSALAILGLATTMLLGLLPASQRITEATRWSRTLVATVRANAANSKALH